MRPRAAVVGEVLLFTAVEIPEFETCEETLCRLLAPPLPTLPRPGGRAGWGQVVDQREHWVPIQQAHRGTRDLMFGSAVYRPEHAGYNNVDDVSRIADYLSAVRPENWRPADLMGLPARG